MWVFTHPLHLEAQSSVRFVVPRWWHCVMLRSASLGSGSAQCCSMIQLCRIDLHLTLAILPNQMDVWQPQHTHWIYKHVCTLVITHTHTHTRTRLTEIHRCTHTHTHTYTHTHTHTHTHWERLQCCLKQRGRWLTMIQCQHWQGG